MTISRFAAGASLAALGLMLAACGGGGVNSTPTPTPTGGTPTPTPTGGTPTPTPTGGTPTPTPTSLVNPATAASYKTKGANISGSINDMGLANAGIATQATTLSINFDPGSRTYKLTRPDGTRTFRQEDQTAIGTAGWPFGRLVYGAYAREVSGGSETLVVSLMPDKALHRLNWVGNGLFIKQVWNGTQYDFSGDSFYFGLPTSAGDVPKTGSAEYAVYAQGLFTERGLPAQILSPRDPSSLIADFGSGTVTVSGSTTSAYILPEGGGGMSYNYSGTASIGANGFSGSFTLGGVGGSWSGEFYGPQAQEVGAMFRGGTGDIDYVGSIVGSRDYEFRGIETDLLSLDNFFAPDGIRLETYQSVDTATGKTLNEGGNNWGGLEVNLVNYDPDTQSWQLANTFTFGAADIAAGQSNSTYTIYGEVGADTNGSNGLKLLNPGPGNPKIQLSYLTYGAWEIGVAGSYPEYSIQRNHVVFGIPTEEATMPHSGSATYSGLVFGIANSTGGADDRFYELAGTLDLSLNFGAGTWSGSVLANGTDRNSGGTRNFGTFGIAPGTITGTSLNATGLTYGGSGTVGEAFGYFFGPQGVEVGGAFSADFADPARSGYQLGIDGVFVSKRD